MTKKDLLFLFLPSVMLVVVLVASITTTQVIGVGHAGEWENKQKFDYFVSDVKNGRTKLTQEEMLAQIIRSHDAAQAERDFNSSTGSLVLSFALMAGAGILCQVATFFYFRRRLQR